MIWNEKTDLKKYFDFSNLIKALKKEKRKKIFLTPFWFKTNFKKQKTNFWIHFLILNKKWISKRSFIFQFLLWNLTMKNKNCSKFVLFWNHFLLSFVHWKCHSIFRLKLKWKRTFFCILISFQDWKIEKRHIYLKIEK